MPDEKDTVFGRLAVERGYATQPQLDEALAAQEAAAGAAGVTIPLAQVMVGKGMLTRDQAQELVNAVAVQTGEARLVAGYEVISKLGQGGMGAVYKAKHPTTGLYVALKVLPPSLATDELVKRFRREAEIVRKLDHDNIVGCVEFGFDKRRKVHFCALELVEGEDLAKRIKRSGKLTEVEAVSITRQMAKALQHAYANGLVHRDVKPENIMVTADGTAKLLDLGLARPADSEATRMTQSGMFVGSPFYASPEQAMAQREIDIRSDIYSLGATLYHMVTGRPPFEGGTALAILQKHVAEKLPWPAEVNPELSDGLCRIIAKMMEKSPDDRYRTPNDLHGDLDLLGGGKEPEVDVAALKNSSVKVPAVRPARRGRPDSRARMAPGRDRAAARRPEGRRRDSARERRRGTEGEPEPREKASGLAALPTGAKIAIGAGALGLVVMIGLVMFLGGGKKPRKPPKPGRPETGGAASRAKPGKVTRKTASPGAGQPAVDTRKVSPPAPTTRAATAADAFREAEAYDLANPKDTAGMIALYEKVAADFPGTREAREAEINVIRLRARVKPVGAAPAQWRPIFDGRTTDCVHKNSRKQWRVVDGALEAVATNGQGFTQRSFADAEIRIRFEARGLTFVSFGVRVDWGSKETAYPASVGYREAQASSMEGRIHEQRFVCRGAHITASLDGRPVPVKLPARLSANGRIMLWAGGKKKEGRLRILSLDFRELPPGVPHAPRPADVPADAARFAGHRYKGYEQQLIWRDAKALCEKQGGHLATITSKEENDFIAGLLPHKSSYYWIGFTDQKQEGKWEWITGEPATFWAWDKGEPNNYAGTEHYAMFNPGKRAWIDKMEMPFFFVCEWEPAPGAKAVVPPAPAGADLTRGLLAHWKLDEAAGAATAADAMGKHDGANSNPAGMSGRAGRIGGAYRLDGGNRITTSMPGPHNTDLTWSAWIRTAGNGGAILANTNGAWVRGGKCLSVRDGKLAVDAHSFHHVTTELVVNDGAWHHVTLTVEYSGRASDTFRVYVDGVEKHVTRNWDFYRAEGAHLKMRIGDCPGNGKGFHGEIDDVRIYDRALSAEEVKALAGMGGGAPEAAATVPRPPPRVPPDAVSFGGHWYKLYLQKMTWHDAKAFCERAGGHLVTIGSKEENEFAVGLARKDAGNSWIGLTNKGQEGRWRWITAEPVTYTRWADAQPDNFLGNQHVVMLRAVDDWRWDDSAVHNRRYFICEWEPGAKAMKPPASSGRSGLLGEYYAGRKFEKLVLSRVDPEIDFDWERGRPAAGMPEDNFSVRWTGELKVPADGRYVFSAFWDDGLRLRVGGLRVIDEWSWGHNSGQGAADLRAGWTPILVEYHEQAGPASVKLSWSGPGLAKTVIPHPNFRTPAAALAAQAEERARREETALTGLPYGSLDRFDSLMAKGDYAGAREAAEAQAAKSANAAGVQTLRTAARIARALEERPGAVRRGARSMVGRDVRLRLRTGAASGRLREVADTHLVLVTTYTINRQKRERRADVAWSSLHAEQVNEFAEAGGWKVAAADRAIAAAYAAFAAKDFELAGNALASITERGNPLAEHLARRTEEANTHAAYDGAMKRARSLVRRRSWKAAAAACEVALRLRPDDPEAAKLLAEAESHIGPAPTLTLDLGGGVTMDFVYIKPGAFMMGNNAGPADQKPEHPVAITKGFYIGKYEVTQAQYRAITGADPSHTKGPGRPVEKVSWLKAVEFCRQAAERTGHAFRLPTEAEWEYACRAGSTGKWCFGNDQAKLTDHAWLDESRPVGGKAPNAWGLYDMHGNVREWCSDWYDPGYYAVSPRRDPTGPPEGSARVQRGGCAGRNVSETWSSGRVRDGPHINYPHIGFRAVVAVPARKAAGTGRVARAAYDKAIARAKMRIRLRNWKGAVEACEEALKLKPGDAEAAKLLAEAQSHLGPPPTLTLDLGRGVTIEMVYIKPGVFVMGGNEDLKYGWQGVEKPKHEVAITRGFYIGKYEVTQAQYEAVVGGNPSRWKEPNRPVEQINWHQAAEFCRLAAERTRRQFRLPTEAEWEYAARAGSTGRYCFGRDGTGLGDYAWFKSNSGGETHPVGRKKPNAWGLHDIHGNVWEWVADRYDPGYYAKSPRENPTGPDAGDRRLLRGGAWRDNGDRCRSAIRHHDTPSFRYDNRGIRAVVSPSPRTSASAQAAYKNAIARARTRVRLKDWKGAAESCEEALKAKPGDAEAAKLLAEARSHLGPSPTLTLDLGRGVTMEFVYIKPGLFMMGGNEDPKEWFQGVEKPAHEVAITEGFYIGKYEVTQAQYEAVTGTNPSQWKQPNRPVERVVWSEAVEFCRLAGGKTGRRLRLPTEAEWEYACRAGSTGRYCFGSGEGGLGDYAWYKNNSAGQTHPVGQKRPSPWGLHDIHGNVWEWVADRYGEGYYANGPRENPSGPAAGAERVLRGGSWYHDGSKCRSAFRFHNKPSYRSYILGFRAVVSASPRASASARPCFRRRRPRDGAS